MTVKEVKKVEQQVLQWLRKEGPVRTSELLKQNAVHVSAPVLRRAVWSLVVDGKAEFTRDRRVRALSTPNAR